MFQVDSVQPGAFQVENADLLAFQLDAFQLTAFQTTEESLPIPEARPRRQTIVVRLPGARIQTPEWERDEEERGPVGPSLPSPPLSPPKNRGRHRPPFRASKPLTSAQLAQILREDEELLLMD